MKHAFYRMLGNKWCQVVPLVTVPGFSAHHTRLRVESHNPRIINSASAARLQHQAPHLVSTAAAKDSSNRSGRTDTAAICIAPRASRSPLTWACASHIPLCRSKTHQHCHLSDDQKDIYARALSRPLVLLEGKTREARQPAQRQMPGETLPPGLACPKSQSEGGGGKIVRSISNRPIPLISRLPFGKSCHQCAR